MAASPWASFCISTYKRPAFLRSQVALLLRQTFTDFEIVISDNDPDASGKSVVEEFADDRVKYFHNSENIGMIKSFNRSIGRATGRFVVMVTDDDPVEINLLKEMYRLVESYPGYSLYGGFERSKRAQGEIEIVKKEHFIAEILDTKKTTWMLWSSAIIDRNAALEVNMIPDFGSPHLADHALIAMAGTVSGGVLINNKFSSLTSHDSNFSKFNFDYYFSGCKGFYETMFSFCKINKQSNKSYEIVHKHLYSWFITNFFTLKRYYSVQSPNKEALEQVNTCAEKILQLEFMSGIRARFHLKQIIFDIKKSLGLLK